ncbi:hypothetical protein QLQ12_26165 [Actinoplanes sp. NEAU-A12]|uniref:RelA/SpoT domain-containing protein n=1 Tax=Actinoplanes sandaracinus TaxID=3045177 RepID=A0ABT6WQU9_9ACTN|nr:hypothetical protein [Actinoplanes sandaracinus]MDI6102108.1 hypothetical protein [Actinoplanes sandaracinus]
MAVPETLRTTYDRHRPILGEIRRYVADTLRPFCDDRKYIFLDRIKDIESLSEKLESGRYSSWQDLDDLYACTVVIPVPEHEENVLDRLVSSFEQVDVKGREQAKKAPEVFRFDGLRWYGRMRTEEASRRQPGMGDIVFEVQVLTAFEHALALVTHDLVYKADNADWKRLRLAAQLKAAVEQIELIIVAFDHAADSVRVSPWPDTTVKAKIIEGFKDLISLGLLPDSLEPLSWRRFGDNVVHLIQSFERNPHNLSNRVDDLLNAAKIHLEAPESPGAPLSGSLFRYVLSLVQNPLVKGSLDKFVVVDSTNLTELYGIKNIKKRFEFPDEPKF